MANKSTITKLIRTGNIFADDYFILTGKERILAGEEIIVTGINKVIDFINQNEDGEEYDTYEISSDLVKYSQYLERKKALGDIRDVSRRENDLGRLWVEIGAYVF